MAAALVLVGVSTGLLVSAWRARQAERARKLIPTRWPLNPRLLANTDERSVWRWLNTSFPDYHVMVKLPVTRFTLPQERVHSKRWYELLSGVYCTLTVCGSDGNVVGCVDVHGNVRLSRRNRQLKQTLLAQCGIAYWVVESRDLPTREEVRAEFLGEIPQNLDGLQSEIHIDAARQKLRAALARQRENREVSRPPKAPYSVRDWRVSESEPSTLTMDSDLPDNSWQQADSFVAPLDSRRGTLH